MNCTGERKNFPPGYSSLLIKKGRRLSKYINSRLILTLLLIAFVVGIFTKSSCYGSSKTNIYLTVDVEDFASDVPLDMIWGTPEKPYGIQKIMGIMEQYNFRGIFFVDVYEWKMYGQEKMKDVCREIDGRGHDVELHTHPVDPETGRKWMYEYTFDEQKKLLEEGVELIRAWTGKDPVAHRAGGYAANYDTLRALESVGIRIDSSMFYNHELSKLNDDLLTINARKRFQKIVEFPVSVVYKKEKIGTLGGFDLYRQNLFLSKLDIDWMDAKGIIRGIKKLRAAGNHDIILFMHSWSLIEGAGKWDDHGYKEVNPDIEGIENLKEVLSFLKNNHEEYEVLTFREVYNRFSEDLYKDSGNDTIPAIDIVRMNIFRWLYYEHGRYIKLLLLFSFIGVVSLIGKKIFLRR